MKGPIPPTVDWHAIAEALKTRPGQWALVATDVDEQHVWRIKNGRNSAFRKRGRYEAAIENRGAYRHRHHGDLYVRYMGPEED